MKTEQIDYSKLNYPIELIRDSEQGGFFATHPDLPGCAAQAESVEEAITNLDDARKLWIESRVEQNLPVPLPLTEEPSGKILLRMTRSVHAELAKHAARQGVSLNLLINSVLAEYVGGAGYRAELATFRRAVDAISALVIRAQQGEQQQAAQSLDLFITDDPSSQWKFVSTVSQSCGTQPQTVFHLFKHYLGGMVRLPALADLKWEEPWLPPLGNEK